MKRFKFLETKRTPRYSLRKLNVGVASVLLGVTIFGINFTNHSVKAATTESVESSNSSPNSNSQQTSAVVNTTVEQTNTQKTTSATQKVQQSSASKNATANNSTEAATTLQSAPKTQGSADTDIKSSTAKSVATNLVTISGTDRMQAAKLATMNLLAMNLMKTTTGTDGAGTANDTNNQPANENNELANKSNLTSSDNYSSNIYKGKDGNYYKIVTISGNDYVYHAADIQANGTNWRGYVKGTAEDNKNNINISKEDLGNGKTRWTVTFFPKMGLQNADSSTLHGLISAKFGIALTNDYQIVGNVDMKVKNKTDQTYIYYTFESGSSSANRNTIQNPSPEVKFSFNPKTDVDKNTGLINSKTMPAYNNEYLQGPYYFTTATNAGKKNLWQTYFKYWGLESKANNNEYDGKPYVGTEHGLNFNNFKIVNENGVDGAKYGDPIIYDKLGDRLNSENGLANSESGVFSSDDFNQAMEFKSQGESTLNIFTDRSQHSSYVISFTTQHTDSDEVGLATGSKNQQFSGISANIYSDQNGYFNMYSRLYGEQRALNAKGDPLIAEKIIPNWDAKKAANAAVDAAVVKQKALITNADNLSDGEKRDLNNQVAAAATNAKKAIDAATTNDGATKAGQDGVAAIEKVVPTSLEDAKKALTDAISKGEAAQKSASYYNDAKAEDKSALDNALSKAATDLNNKALTQATATQDAQAIEDAINGLKGQTTKLDKLNQAISDGTSAQAGSKYANSSAESKGALDQAINAGKTAKTQSGLTQKEADDDASAIEKAINGLSGKDTDKTALNEAINKGHKTQTGSSDYQDTSDAKRSQLDKDITDAETLNQDPKASQSNVDAAAKKISDDINNLNQGTDATKNKPVIPASKIPVGDHSHLTDSEKDQVKKKLEEANKGKFPDGTKVTVGDDGTTTVTYPDGSKDTIPGRDLIIGVKGEDISGNKHDSNSPSGSNTDDETNGNNVNNAEGMNGNIAKSGSKNNSLKTLPQTGTKDVTILEILGLFLSLFGLLGLKKKHREE